MSEDTAPLVVTLKAGTGYDAPWIVVRGDNPDDVAAKLRGLDAVIEATHEAAGLFIAGRLGKQAPAEAPAAPPTEQPRQQGWGASPAATQQGAAPAQRSKFAGTPHPEGKTCAICPNVLEKKTTSSNKPVWRCPDWRWGNGQPNGHSSEWID